MTKELFIHVGAHKTGTSLIQTIARGNIQHLSDQGIEVVDRPAVNTLFKWGVPRVNAEQNLKTIVDKALNKAETGAYFSHENMMGKPFHRELPGLYPNADKNFRGMASIFRRFNPKVMICVRNLSEFVESYYLQSIHEGGTKKFDAWVSRVDLDNLTWVPVIEAAQRNFGTENVLVFDFEALRTDRERFINNFFSVIGVDASGFSLETVRENRSISDKGLSIALAANAFLESDEERRYMRRFLQERFSNKSYPRPRLLSKDQRINLDIQFSRDIDQLSLDRLSHDS